MLGYTVEHIQAQLIPGEPEVRWNLSRAVEEAAEMLS